MLIDKEKMRNQRKSLTAKMLIIFLLLGTTPVTAAEKQAEETDSRLRKVT